MLTEIQIKKYEPDQELMEREAWHSFSMQMLARAYGEDEPEYTTDMLKWVNPDYLKVPFSTFKVIRM